MIVSCKSRMRVPSVKARVKVGCTSMGVASFGTTTGLGVGVSSLTGMSFEVRVIGNVFIKASSEIDTTKMAALLSAFLIPSGRILKLLRNLGVVSFVSSQKATN